MMWFIAAYVIVGLVTAAWALRRGSGWGEIVLAVSLWPFWGPFLVLDRSAPTASHSPPTPLQMRLHECVTVAAGTPFATVLHPAAAERLGDVIAAGESRYLELESWLGRRELSLAAAERKYHALPAQSAARATAHLHLQSVRRLHRLRDEQASALRALEDALGTLYGQLVLARFAEAPAADLGDMVAEMWHRVEGIGSVLHLEAPEGLESAA
ncbi:MAG: hypothetical protein AAGN82_09395 [Myxococcota bacterium]